VRFLINNMALGQVHLRVLQLLPVSIIALNFMLLGKRQPRLHVPLSLLSTVGFVAVHCVSSNIALSKEHSQETADCYVTAVSPVLNISVF
jgi:hypothetical protein